MDHREPGDSPTGDGPDGAGFGCPMLVRGHATVALGHRPLVRCSLGWAVRGEPEIARCVATESSARCWRAGEDHGALYEAAFTASRSAKRRAAATHHAPPADDAPAVVDPQPSGREVPVPPGLGGPVMASRPPVRRAAARPRTDQAAPPRVDGPVAAAEP
jgi:hypothetical protein